MLLKIWKMTNESTNGTWVAGGLPLNQWPGQALLAAWSIFGKAHMLHGAGIFTYKTGRFLGHMLVNIPYMEHMGYRVWMFIIYIYYTYIYIYTVCGCAANSINPNCVYLRDCAWWASPILWWWKLPLLPTFPCRRSLLAVLIIEETPITCEKIHVDLPESS